MIQSSATELVEYTTACRLAAVYQRNTARIVECLQEARNLTAEMADMFGNSNYAMGFEIEHRGHRISIDSLEKRFKIAAWSLLVEKIGIRKVMSSKRQEELNKILHSHNPADADKLPDICEDTIYDVLQGYVASAEEFLHESIREEYDWLRPRIMGRSQYKTNEKNFYKLGKKVILTYAVELGWGGRRFDVGYYTQPHLMAVDNIFHLLDGQGAIQGAYGELVDAIRTAESGAGQTKYVRFKCYRNRNLHLEFTREDLLEKFNAICGRNYLPPASES